MKKIILPIFGLLLLSTACSDKKAQTTEVLDQNDTIAADWGEADVPMPIFGVEVVDNDYNVIDVKLRHIYDSQDDSTLYTSVAANYHTLVNGENTATITFEGKQEGKEMGSMIYGKYSYCMKGLNYSSKGELLDGIAFTDNFMKTHEVVKIKYPDGDELVTAPQSLIDTLQARYHNDVLSSVLCASSSDDQLQIYSVQMQPQGDRCLGMRVISDGGELHILEEWSEDYNDMSAWHVDDGGEYYPFSPMVVTKGKKGYDIFYFEGSAESSSYCVMLVRRDSVVDMNLCGYYNYIDYLPTPDAVDLPAGSELKAELDGYKVWIHTDKEPSLEDSAGQYSVYYSTPQAPGEIFRLVTTREDTSEEPDWESPYRVAWDKVQSAQEAYLIKDPNYDFYCHLVIEGCPDDRHIFSYCIQIPIDRIEPYFTWIKANGGFMGVDESGKQLKFLNNMFTPDGDSSICQYYDLNYDLVKEEVVEL